MTTDTDKTDELVGGPSPTRLPGETFGEFTLRINEWLATPRGIQHAADQARSRTAEIEACQIQRKTYPDRRPTSASPMNSRAIAFGQIRAALAVLVQAGKTLDEDHEIRGRTAALSQPEWRNVTAHLTDAGKCCVLAMNVLTEDRMEDTQCR